MDILVIIPGAFGAFRMKTVAKIGLYDKDGSVETMEYYTKIGQSVDVVCYTSE
jgi:hypothetical protein